MTTTGIVPAQTDVALERVRELTPAVSQRVFRSVMDAVARPGSRQRIPVDALPSGVAGAALPLLALADIMTPIGALGDDPATVAMAQAIGRVVGAQVVQASTARYALALQEPTAMAELSPGSHWSPETGTTLVQRVGELTFGGADARWALTGPGIAPGAPVRLSVAGLTERFVSDRAALVGDYPAGIDCLLVTDDGDLVALPRTTRIEMI